MRDIYVSIGSNIDAECNIRSAVEALRQAFGPLDLSPVYRSQAVGFAGEDFYNLVARFSSDLTARDIQQVLRDIEDEHGRERGGDRFSSRTLDIDILLVADECSDDPDLEIPRDEIARYAFVLAPLNDMASDLPHPRLGVSVGELWAQMQQEDSRQVGSIRQVAVDFA